MALNPGTKLGSYEVLSSLGAGGMGEVYRAHDTKLNRDVALKVLPEAFAADAQRMGRFEREAQVLASMNHPNIAAIYGLEESGSTRALVMELVEGQTLDELLGTGKSKIENRKSGVETRTGFDLRAANAEPLSIARQIAEALEYAHERGIIHRDLKPANIKITPEGAVKVLDFGLAKALDTDTSATSGVSSSPTLTAVATQAGVIIGTAAYMSPEQARGKAVDRRADIWAFGCVLYEMFSGKRLFAGETISDTLAAVIMKEPEWEALPPTTPAPIQKLIRRCLTKDPRQRLRDIGEARIVIEQTISGVGPIQEPPQPAVAPPAALPPEPERRSSARSLLPWGVAAAAIAAAVLLGVGHFGSSTAPARTIRSTISPPEGVSFASSGTYGGGAVISPDGAHLVVPARDASGKYSLWVRQLDSLTLQKLEGTEGARYPFWSADSRFVAFFVPGKLKKIDVTGGPPQSVCDAPSGRGGAWSKNDIIVFSPDVSAGLSSVPAAGGASTALVPLDKSRQQSSLRWPEFLPDGRHFLYWGGDPYSSENSGIYIASIEGKDSRFLFKSDTNAVFAPSGYLLYLKEQNLMAQPFDASSLKLTGTAFPIAEQIANPEAFRLGFFSVSQNDILVYQTGGAVKRQVLSLDPTGKQLGQVGNNTNALYIQLSPDGRRLAETLYDDQSKSGDIWLVDLARGVQTRFTFDPKDDDTPVFSPDGSRIVFASNRKGQYDLYVKDASGAGTPQALFETKEDKYPTDWSRDGKYIAFTQVTSAGKSGVDLWILPLFGDKKPFPFLQTDFAEADGVFSPDGHWLAYESNESGKVEVYIAPFNGNTGLTGGGSAVQGGKWQVSQGGGTLPAWSRDGKCLYFLSPDNQLMQAEINAKGSAVEVGVPRTVFQALFASVGAGARTYDVAPDAKHIYILGTKETASVPITLVADWTAGIKK
jgi:eukaryotic-like serine/threonine-protein kinase